MIDDLSWAAGGAFGVLLVLVLTRITVADREFAGRPALRLLDVATGLAVAVLVALLVSRVLAEL